MQAKPDFILPLSDASAELSQIGGKGASLARMAAVGLPVPSGFCITTAAYRCFVDANGLQARILEALKDVDASLPATLEAASASIGRFFADAQIPSEIADAVLGAYRSLGPQTMDAGRRTMVSVAVRSSATAEDLPGASFAGQQETYLNICGEKALLEAVRDCWASLWTARAIAYRIKSDIDQNTVALAVVIQEMVDAEAAGVLFTANPINGRRDEVVINAAWGLGEAIVGGLVSPDTIIADKVTGKIKKVDIAEKTVITVMTESGTEERPLNDVRRKSQVLKGAQVIELVSMARRIEDYYGSPQDIEWALTSPPAQKGEGGFAIVQSRPITALPEPPLEWHLSQPHTVAARMSFVELVPDVVKPLFATLAVPIASQATANLMAALGLGETSGDYFEAINGYVYGCFDTRTVF